MHHKSQVNRHNQRLTFCIYPENLSAVEEMEFLTRRSRSFFTSGHEISFLASRCAKRLKNKMNIMLGQVLIGKSLTTVTAEDSERSPPIAKIRSKGTYPLPDESVAFTSFNFVHSV